MRTGITSDRLLYPDISLIARSGAGKQVARRVATGYGFRERPRADSLSDPSASCLVADAKAVNGEAAGMTRCTSTGTP